MTKRMPITVYLCLIHLTVIFFIEDVYAIYCGEIEPIQYGDIIASARPPYQVGTTLTFECDRGFKGQGKGSITCMKDGRWSGPVPYCTAYQCRRDLTKIEEGRKCRKPCDTDADCRGTFKKCRCDDWCGKTCFNPDADCSTLKDPVNGYIIGKEIAYGYTVTFGCNEGFILTGPATRRCRSDRKWSGYEPKCVAFSTCGQPGDKEDTPFSGKVIEGTDAKEGAWPWQAVVFHNDEHSVDQIYNRKSAFGGGSIIDDKWILSAAHVFGVFPANSDWKKRFLIAVGMTTYPEPGEAIPDHVNIFEPGELYRHPKYNSISFDYDVALIRIGKRLIRKEGKFVTDSSADHDKLTFSRFIRPVCLPCMKGDPLGPIDIWKNFDNEACNPRSRSILPSLISAGNFVMVTGFGWKRNAGEQYSFRPKKLQEGLLKIIEDAKCIASVKTIQKDVRDARYTDRMICAASADSSQNVDSCQGDSGGPLVKQFDHTEHTKYWMQVGIVSWGWGCGSKHPGYYTGVKEVMSWVWNVIDDTRIGTWYNWAPWSRCSKTCGRGKMRRERTCAEKNCPGSNRDKKYCNTNSCPTGVQCPNVQSLPNVRMALNPPDLQFSVGTKVTFSCLEGMFLKSGPLSITCLPDGKWSDTQLPVCEVEWTGWSTWSPCTATCGGARYKTRVCRRGNDFLTKAFGCKGPTILYSKKTCNAEACPTGTSGCQDGDLCLQGDINVNTKNILPHVSNLFGMFGGRKK
uniref:clotting factor C-like n=1 Tax=Styela clava TaxID=7725 RepID=UPI00193AA3E2|nr:clotting factor C-like [Styela clava]